MTLSRNAALAVALLWSSVVGAAEPSPDDRANLHWLRQEVEIAGALDDLSGRALSGLIAFKDIAVVDPRSGSALALAHQTVVVRDGRIAWVGDSAAAPDLTTAKIIDGHGLFLSPGLVDMHVHTVSLSEQLLRLATGNTSVRDMDGFPWMLELRRAIASGQLVAPTEYIAGTIITSYPLDGYSVVVHTVDEARTQVRNQAACGYDFIKVHNVLKPPLFDAVADEARRAGLDLIGHIPHDITIDHAVHSGGMRTLEHLKGFISDRTLVVSDEDYAAGLADAQVWLTPTFYAMTGGHRAANAQATLSLPEMLYVPLRKRLEWKTAGIDPHDAKGQALLDVAIPLAMKRLLPLHPHWLAGTDAAQYPFQVAGFALLDELIEMEQFGIPRIEVLRAATSEPAAALRHANEFGAVATGARADLVVLGSDPTQDLHAYRDNRGVMVRGRFLDHSSLAAALARLAAIEAEPDVDYRVNRGSVELLNRDVEKLARRHVALDAKHLVPLAATLARLGYTKASVMLQALIAGNESGPCAEITPEGGG